MITRRELASRQKAFAHDRAWRFFPRWMALLGVMVFGPFGLGAAVRAFHGGPEWLAIGLGFVGIVAAPLWAWVGDVWLARLYRAHEVVCPECGKPLIGLTGELALTTGRCGGCGALIVGDDEGRDGPLPAP